MYSNVHFMLHIPATQEHNVAQFKCIVELVEIFDIHE